jgi:hypothetical protein
VLSPAAAPIGRAITVAVITVRPDHDNGRWRCGVYRGTRLDRDRDAASEGGTYEG